MNLRAILLALCAVVIAGLAAGCGSGGGDDSSGSSAAGASTESSGSSETSSGDPSETTSTKQKTKPTVTVPKEITPTKFAINEVEEGTGAKAKPGDKVTVQYVGVGYNSEEEFDSSWSRNEPLSFTIGAGEVINGWEQGMKGMKVGGRREMLIPASLAYGSEGRPPKIGPNEALVFTIDLLAVE
jgi:peptidylprolyl isomerase